MLVLGDYHVAKPCYCIVPRPFRILLRRDFFNVPTFLQRPTVAEVSYTLINVPSAHERLPRVNTCLSDTSISLQHLRRCRRCWAKELIWLLARHLITRRPGIAVKAAFATGEVFLVWWLEVLELLRSFISITTPSSEYTT